MAFQAENPKSKFTTPAIEEPPEYDSLDATSSLATITAACNISSPSNVNFHAWHTVYPDCLEDTRRTLAQHFPSLDAPWEVRFSETNSWIAEQNEWLNTVKRGYGCATHDLQLPPLVALEDPNITSAACKPFTSQTQSELERKLSSAIAVARGCRRVMMVQQSRLKSYNDQDHLDAYDKWMRAWIVQGAAKAIIRYYKYAEENHQSIPTQTSNNKKRLYYDLFALVNMTNAAAAIVTVAYTQARYQLWVAEQNEHEEINIAIQRAVRALDALVIAGQLKNAAHNRSIRMRRREWPIRSRLREVRTQMGLLLSHRCGCLCHLIYRWYSRTS